MFVDPVTPHSPPEPAPDDWPWDVVVIVDSTVGERVRTIHIPIRITWIVSAITSLEGPMA